MGRRIELLEGIEVRATSASSRLSVGMAWIPPRTSHTLDISPSAKNSVYSQFENRRLKLTLASGVLKGLSHSHQVMSRLSSPSKYAPPSHTRGCHAMSKVYPTSRFAAHALKSASSSP